MIFKTTVCFNIAAMFWRLPIVIVLSCFHDNTHHNTVRQFFTTLENHHWSIISILYTVYYANVKTDSCKFLPQSIVMNHVHVAAKIEPGLAPVHSAPATLFQFIPPHLYQ